MECAIAVFLQESSPSENIADVRIGSDLFCICLSWPHGTYIAFTVAEGPRRKSGRCGVSNGIKDVLKIGRGLSDLPNHLRVIVVKDMFGAAGSDKICIVRMTSRDYIKAIDHGELNGVRMLMQPEQRMILQQMKYSQLPPQTKKLVPWDLERSMFKQPLENKASHAVAAARGTVIDSSREMLLGNLKEMRSSAMVY